MKIYIGGDYNNPATYQRFAKELQTMEHEVTSRWLDVPPFSQISEGLTQDELIKTWFGTMMQESGTSNPSSRYAENCREDIEKADLVIVFANGSPGWDAGYAYGVRKRLIVVSDSESPLTVMTKMDIAFHASPPLRVGGWESVKKFLEMQSRTRQVVMGTPGR